MTATPANQGAAPTPWTVHERDGSVLATVEGWHQRYADHPMIAKQAAAASVSPNHTLLYRGQKKIDHIEGVFTIGQKARPLYHLGDRTKLERRLSTMATDRAWFGQLAGAFLGSRVGGESAVTFGQLLERFDARGETDRILLTQVLLEALQYRNCQLTGKQWRDYLFLLSATTNAERAAMYALQNNPKTAYVLDYVPPHGRNLARSVTHFHSEYAALGLGETFPDEDNEYLIRYAMLPHFLLGYTRLDRQGKGPPCSYRATYVPNPVYADGTATLDNPPELNAAQEGVFRKTLPDIAWVVNYDGQARSGWGQIHTPDGAQPLDPPMPVERMEGSAIRSSRPT